MTKFNYIKSIIPSLVFCLRFLPLRQALKIPILVNKMHLISSKGRITINSKTIKTGMIRMGFLDVRAFPNTGMHLSLDGEIIFEGKCVLGNNSYVVCGSQGKIVFGDDFHSSTSIHLVSMCRVVFGEHVRVGWDCEIMDTNFHPLFDLERKQFKKAYGPIIIGNNNWFGTRCIVMHSVKTPNHCIFGANSVITRGGQYEENCVHGGSPVHVLSRNIVRIIGQDQIYDYCNC